MRPVRADAEQMADGEHEVRAVHGVEVEILDALLGQLLHLACGDGGGDELAGLGVIVEPFEFRCEPVRHGCAGARGAVASISVALRPAASRAIARLAPTSPPPTIKMSVLSRIV